MSACNSDNVSALFTRRYNLSLVVVFCDVFFFFSSRRRHTRLVSDWSSDVCSSDLAAVAGDREPYLRSSAVRGAVEDRPRRVHVILVGAADDVVDRDPLLVLDVARLPGRGVVRWLERLAAVGLDPVVAHVVVEGPSDD